MESHELRRLLTQRISSRPVLPSAEPTKSAWQDPPHPVSKAQSAVFPDAADVVIIGSGVTGCSVAKALLEDLGSDLRVVMLEARQAVSGATGRNGGHLISDAAQLIGRNQDMQDDVALQILQFSERNINALKQLVSDLGEHQAYIGLRDVTATAAFADAEAFDAAAKGNGGCSKLYPDSTIRNSTLETRTAAEEFQYKGPVSGALQQEGAGALSPYRLMTTLLGNLLQNPRFSLETSTPAQSIEHHTQGTPYRIVTPRGSIQCHKIVHCTNGHAGHLLPGLVGGLYPVRGTMSAQTPAGSFPDLGDKISWSYFSRPRFNPATFVYHTGLSYAQQYKSRIFIGGGCDRIDEMISSDDSKLTREAQDNIFTSATSLLQGAEPISERSAWSGIMGFTSDGFPLVGRLWPEVTGRPGQGEWVAAGFNGHGMDKCWLAGKAVAAMVLGQQGDVPSAFLFTPERFGRLGVEQSVTGLTEELMSCG